MKLASCGREKLFAFFVDFHNIVNKRYNKPIVSVWGNTVPEFGMYPYKADYSRIIQVKDLSCRPCSKIGFKNCPKGHFKCMNLIDLNLLIKESNV